MRVLDRGALTRTPARRARACHFNAMLDPSRIGWYKVEVIVSGLWAIALTVSPPHLPHYGPPTSQWWVRRRSATRSNTSGMQWPWGQKKAVVMISHQGLEEWG
jgi:hypothetical protein